MNNDKVLVMPASAHLKPDQAIDSLQHRKGDLTDILVLAYDTDGELFVRSSFLTRAEALFLLEKGRDWVLNG
jgi:hypothetical protein